MGYYLELLTPETIKLLGSTKSKKKKKKKKKKKMGKIFFI